MAVIVKKVRHGQSHSLLNKTR